MNKQRKILLLGGSYAQLPAIEVAKKRGLYTILVDYLTDNPGQHLTDKYINASTTDKKKVLEIAKDLRVDFVLAYASDPAAPTAAYVSEKLGLPGNSYESVKVLSEKHLFRNLLQKAGLNSPKSKSYSEKEISTINKLDLDYPLIVKPVDSSGSKGVKLIESFDEFNGAALHALSFSRSKRVIAEEYIRANGSQLHGDGFVIDGELSYCYLGDHHYNNAINSFVPYSTTWPTNKTEQQLEEIYSEISKLIRYSGFQTGAINIEVRIDNFGNIFIMEIGPRSGGNFVPKLLNYATGFNMIEASLDAAIGKKVMVPDTEKNNAAYYVLHTNTDGVFKHISISAILKSYINEYHQYSKKGDNVSSFQGANAALGILLMTFPDSKTMDHVISNMDKYVEIEVD